MFSRLRERIGKESFFGSAPSPFVGRFGYPYVNVGILSPAEINEESWKHDAPEFWAQSNFSVSDVVDLRAGLVNSRAKAAVKGSERITAIGQEVAMSSKPVDVEVSFERKPNIGMIFSNYSSPIGPSLELKKAEIASNPRIHAKVEKVYSDSDLKAAEALNYLYKGGFEVSFLSKILSVATVGLKFNRKLVPTRFSITATDDIIGKELISDVKEFGTIDEHLAFFGSYLGNYYLVLMFPGVWSYELFEAYARGNDFATDYETYSGRKSYAETTAGGYYAARLPLLEKLISMKRQAAVMIIRIITDEYTMPLGVWVCRQAMRKSVQARPISFASKELMLKYAETLVSKRLGYRHVQKMFTASKMLSSMKQSRLSAYF